MYEHNAPILRLDNTEEIAARIQDDVLLATWDFHNTYIPRSQGKHIVEVANSLFIDRQSELDLYRGQAFCTGAAVMLAALDSTVIDPEIHNETMNQFTSQPMPYRKDTRHQKKIELVDKMAGLGHVLHPEMTEATEAVAQDFLNKTMEMSVEDAVRSGTGYTLWRAHRSWQEARRIIAAKNGTTHENEEEKLSLEVARLTVDIDWDDLLKG